LVRNNSSIPTGPSDRHRDAVGVSVIIGSYNGAQTLGATLDALDHQDAEVPFEVIVVNDGSTDATSKVASQHDVRVIDLDANYGKGHALNVAIREALAPIIALLDDDCIPPPRWVQSIADAWTTVDENVTMIGGTILPLSTNTYNRRYVAYRCPLAPQEAELDENATLAIRFRFALAPPRTRTERRTVFYPAGANMSVRTHAVRQFAGFPEWRGFGEEEFCATRLRKAFGKGTALFLPDIIMYHDYNASLRDTFRRARAYGWSAGRKWAESSGIPSIKPVPLIGAILSASVALVSIPVGVFILAASPLLLYRRWVFEIRNNQSLEAMSYPYIHAAEDLATDVGFARGYLQEIRESHRSLRNASS